MPRMRVTLRTHASPRPQTDTLPAMPNSSKTMTRVVGHGTHLAGPSNVPFRGTHHERVLGQGEGMTDSAHDEHSVTGPVETAIRMHIAPGTRLPTPTGRATFIVNDLRPDGMVLLLGAKPTMTVPSWDCLEEIIGDLDGRGWMRIGANRDVNGNPGTLDGYLKNHIKRQVADYVAVVLERAHLVELNRDRPASLRRIRLLVAQPQGGHQQANERTRLQAPDPAKLADEPSPHREQE
jgi:hypothetical protein